MDLFNQNAYNKNNGLIQGLEYHSDFITTSEQNELLAIIDSMEWLSDLKRRVQHYGYKYDYKKRHIDNTMILGDIPEWIKKIIKQIQYKGVIDFIPDQVIINEYMPGQGIANHIDCEPCFSDTIVSLSLSSSCIMYFTNKYNFQEIIPVYLEPRSLVLLKGDARYNWMHGIRAVKTDNYYGQKIQRDRRVSITFRKVKINLE